jgi:hypothetical protein
MSEEFLKWAWFTLQKERESCILDYKMPRADLQNFIKEVEALLFKK